MKKLQRFVRKITKKERSRRNSKIVILNESVNFEKRCIFIAIPKTGTTSVRSQLKQQGEPLISNPHLDIVQVRDSLYVFFLMKALGRNLIFPTESISKDIDIRTHASTLFDSYFKFASVRNPWARAVSLYFRKEGVEVSNEMSFEEFCDNHRFASDTCMHPTLHKNQYDWLCDETGTLIMDYVYKVESFDNAISEIEERTNGMVKLISKKARHNKQSLSYSYRDIYTSKTKTIIAKTFEKDIDYFKYSY